jgi:small-conductance mechanosensitive channel
MKTHKLTQLKTFIFSLAWVGFMAITLPGIAQIGDVEEVNSEMNLGTQRGWKIFVPDASVDMVEKEMKRLIKTYKGKSVRLRKTDDLAAESLEIPGLSEQPVKLYYQITTATRGSYLITFVEVNERFLSSEFHPEESEFWKKELKNVARNAAIATIEEEIEEAQKELSKREKDLKGLQKDKEDFEQDIRDCEETIAERKRNITDNEKAQEKKKTEVEQQKSAIDKIRERLSAY